MPSALERIVGEFTLELDDIDRCLTENRFPQVSCRVLPYDPIADGCVVALWDLWGRAVRTLVLECAAGPIITISGTVLIPRVARDETRALSRLVQEKAINHAPYSLSFGVRGEPKWHMSGDVEAIANALELPLASQFGAAFGVSQISLQSGVVLDNPIRGIQSVRNFIAHKGGRTLRTARRDAHGLGDRTVGEYVREVTRGGSTRFADWVDSMKVMLESAAG